MILEQWRRGTVHSSTFHSPHMLHPLLRLCKGVDVPSGLWHSHGLVFYFCPRFAFCLHSTYFFLKPVAGKGMMAMDTL